MDIDEELLKVVAAGLTRGQGAFSEEELAAAYQEVFANRIAGALVELLLEGQLALRVNDKEEVQYIGVELADRKLKDAEIAAAVEAFISSTRPPKES